MALNVLALARVRLDLRLDLRRRPWSDGGQ